MGKLSKLSSPLKWAGSKIRLARSLRRYMPLHGSYCEVFGGGGALLFCKLPSASETWNDLDYWVYNLFSVLKNDGDNLQQRLAAMSFADIEALWAAPFPKTGSALDKAAWVFLKNRGSYNGEMNKGGWFALYKPNTWSVYRNSIEKLSIYRARLSGVNIRNECFETLLPRFKRSTDFLYLDPPYRFAMRTCRGRNLYFHEMTDNQHERLLNLAKQSQAMVMLSGYRWNMLSHERDEMYDSILSDWFSVTFPTTSPAAQWNTKSGNTSYREEVVWLNPLARETLAEHGSDILREKYQARAIA